jgi:hypothetical protein
MMIRRAFLRIAAVGALLVAVTGFGVAAPANAAPKPIGLSSDGTTYTDQLSGSLFAGAVIVPGSTITRSFWVKNRNTTAGNLAIAVQDVSGANNAMIAALSLSANSGSHSGSNVPFSTVDPCRSLLSALTMAPGDEVRVDVKLKLSSSLNHLTAQSSVGAFKVRVVLTSTDVAAPDGCAAVSPPQGGGDTPGGNPGGGNTTPPGQIDTEVISGAADGNVLPTLAQGPLSGLGGKGSVYNSAIEPNTARFFQEFDVVWWLVALMLGGIFAWYRRRNESLEEVY